MWMVGLQADAPSLQQEKMDARGLPNISTRSRIESGQFDLFADFLVWKASEEPTAFWTNSVKIRPDLTVVFDAQDFTFPWDLGFRVGAGYHFVYDQWDTQVYWTRFHTGAHHHAPSNGYANLSQFFAGFIDEFTGGLNNYAESAKIHWTLRYDMIDWDLGRSFWVSKGLSLRPFLGIKGGWINQEIHTKWNNITTVAPIIHFPSTENLKNNFWGVGPSAGVKTKWKIRQFGSQFISFFGDFSSAMLWGTWVETDVYKNPMPRKVVIHMKNSELGSLMLQGFLGMGYDADFNKGRTHFALRLGYEMQLWFNQLRLITFNQLLLHGDLSLQGGTLNCCIDF